MMLIPIKRLFVITFSLIVLTCISVLYLDRPIALFIHNYGWDSRMIFLRIFTEYLPVFILLLLAICILLKVGITFVTKIIVIVYFYITLYITMEIKTLLKLIFGRYWPKTWIKNNLSLINNNVFGFDFWHGVGNMGSFPSGHTTLTTFCVVWLIYLHPNKKWWWIILGIFVVISLIVLDYHFLGDCFAGLTLGLNLGILIIYMKQRCIVTILF